MASAQSARYAMLIGTRQAKEERMHDLIIRNGTIVDGSGLPRYRADVGIAKGKIAAIGRINERAKEVIDAEGHIVAPGIIDAHTHMDAQVFWDPLGTCSCWHGITSVVMGNCGFSLAPCAASDKHLVVRNLERAEDISGAAMDDVPGVARLSGELAQGHQLRELSRALRVAHVRDGRARLRSGGDRGRA